MVIVTYLSLEKVLGALHARLGHVNLPYLVKELLETGALLELAVLCLAKDHKKLLEVDLVVLIFVDLAYHVLQA